MDKESSSKMKKGSLFETLAGVPSFLCLAAKNRQAEENQNIFPFEYFWGMNYQNQNYVH